MKFKYKMFLKLAILLDYLSLGFYNLSCGEKWNADMDYESDLTYDDLYDTQKKRATEYLNSQCRGERDE